MTKIINSIKKGMKWYFNQAAQTYAWLPSGTIPHVV